MIPHKLASKILFYSVITTVLAFMAIMISKSLKGHCCDLLLLVVYVTVTMLKVLCIGYLSYKLWTIKNELTECEWLGQAAE